MKKISCDNCGHILGSVRGSINEYFCPICDHLLLEHVAIAIEENNPFIKDFVISNLNAIDPHKWIDLLEYKDNLLEKFIGLYMEAKHRNEFLNDYDNFHDTIGKFYESIGPLLTKRMMEKFISFINKKKYLDYDTVQIFDQVGWFKYLARFSPFDILKHLSNYKLLFILSIIISLKNNNHDNHIINSLDGVITIYSELTKITGIGNRSLTQLYKYLQEPIIRDIFSLNQPLEIPISKLEKAVLKIFNLRGIIKSKGIIYLEKI